MAWKLKQFMSQSLSAFEDGRTLRELCNLLGLEVKAWHSLKLSTDTLSWHCTKIML